MLLSLLQFTRTVLSTLSAIKIFFMLSLLLSTYFGNIGLLVVTNIIIAVVSFISFAIIILMMYNIVSNHIKFVYENKYELNNIPIMESAKSSFSWLIVSIVFLSVLLTRNSIIYPYLLDNILYIGNSPKMLLVTVIILWLWVSILISIGIINRHIMVINIVIRVTITPLIIIGLSILMSVEIPIIGMNILTYFSIEFLFLPLTNLGGYILQMNSGNGSSSSSGAGGPSNPGSGNGPSNNPGPGNGPSNNPGPGNGPSNNSAPGRWVSRQVEWFVGIPGFEVPGLPPRDVDMAYVLIPASTEFVEGPYPEYGDPIQPKRINKSLIGIIDRNHPDGGMLETLRVPADNPGTTPSGNFCLDGVFYRALLYSRTNGIRKEEGIEFPSLRCDPEELYVTTMNHPVPMGPNGERTVYPLGRAFDKKAKSTW